MRKILIFIIGAAMLLLAACGADSKTGTSPSESAASETSASSSASEPAPTPTGGAVPGVNADNYPRVDGSTANMPMMAKLYSEVCGVPLEEAETMVKASGGTGAVWRSMLYEGADLLLAYEAPENVKAELDEAGIKLDAKPIGKDGLVFLVNAKNSVDSLTQQQLIDIYTGKITDWSGVGGAAGPIVPFQRNKESGSQTLFLKLLMKDIAPMEAPTELVPAEMGALIDEVAKYDGQGGSIGYSVFYYASLMYENPDLKLLQVDGVAPTNETIADGSYPLQNEFYAVVRESEPADSPARLLQEFLLTEAGKKIIADDGYVPIK